jgi:excinuclease UvrABC ATPase subunit
LHMVDVERLVSVLRKLIEKGNTVVLIEHNLDVVTQADQLIELGPGPGGAGGEIVFEGTPRELLARRVSTATAQSARSRSDKLRQLWERAVGHDQPSAPGRSNASSIAAVP